MSILLWVCFSALAAWPMIFNTSVFVLAFSKASLWYSIVVRVPVNQPLKSHCLKMIYRPSICSNCLSILFLRFRAWRLTLLFFVPFFLIMSSSSFCFFSKYSCFLWSISSTSRSLTINYWIRCRKVKERHDSLLDGLSRRGRRLLGRRLATEQLEEWHFGTLSVGLGLRVLPM